MVTNTVRPRTEIDAKAFGELRLEWLIPLLGQPLHHKDRFIKIFGEDFYEQVLSDAATDLAFPPELLPYLLDNFMAYMQACAATQDLADPLAIAVLPRQLLYYFTRYTQAWSILGYELAGPEQRIDFDPTCVEEPADSRAALKRTTSLFGANGIRFHHLLWEDYRYFAYGVEAVPGGIRPAE